MSTNCVNLPAGLTFVTSVGSAQQTPQPNAQAGASQMVPLIMQMQPGGSISFIPCQAQAQAQAQNMQQVPQWLGMSGSTQSPAIPQSQTQFMPSAPSITLPSQTVGTMNDLMTLAAAMQQVTADAPVGSVPDDEEVLIKAVRKGIARGLTYEQALRGLHNTNRHTETAWKNYFLAHLDRLYPKLYARKEGHPRPGIPSSGSQGQPLYLINNNSQTARSAPPKTIKREKPASAAYGHYKSPSQHHSGPRSEHTSDRHKPASSRAQHPPSVGVKGKDTKVRLASHAGKGSGIGIKKPRIKRRVARSPTPTPTPTTEFSAVSSSSESEPEDRASEGSDAESEDEQARTRTKDEGPQNMCSGPQKVTDDDFRAMARYIYETPPERDESPTGLAFWRKFAYRKENAKRRSLDAWARAARTHQEKIALYVEEYAKEVEEDSRNSEDDQEVPSAQEEVLDTESTPQEIPIDVPVDTGRRVEAATVPQKRPPSPSEVGGNRGPDEKRARQEASESGPVEAVVSESPRAVKDAIPVSEDVV